MFAIKEISTTEIIVKDRARKDFGDLEELKHSIIEQGLLYPILIDDNNNLLDGGRRLRAHEELSIFKIPCRILSGVTSSDAKILERISNVARKSFEWHEELMIKYDLHYMWEASHDKWGYRDTAKRLNCALGGISSDLALAEAIKIFPELINCKTKAKARDAYKKMQSQAEAIQAMDSLSSEEQSRLQSMLAGKSSISTSKKNISPEPEKSISIPGAIHSDHHPGEIQSGKQNKEKVTSQENLSKLPEYVYEIGSNRDFIPKIPNNTVGFVELDPPYAINFNETYGKVGKIETTEDDWTLEILREWYTDMLPILHSKLLDNSWILCWTAKEHWIWTNEIASGCGFGTQSPGIWAKPGGSCNTPTTTMISNYEMFLLFRKGKATFNIPSFNSVMNYNSPVASQRGHQWEKPIDMYDYFIKAIGKPGAIFLSPFAGSGNSMVSAALNGMTPMGCDMKQQYLYQFHNTLKNHFYKKEVSDEIPW